MPRLTIHFIRFGPYHLARLKSAKAALEPMGWQVRGLQICATDAVYAWDDSGDVSKCREIETLCPDGHYEDLRKQELQSAIEESLNKEPPDAIAIAGWGTPDALACLKWARRNSVSRILMSETRHCDGDRVWWKEMLKSRVVKRFDSAIVGSQSHAEYLVKLGLQHSQIQRGYNVIDNEYFERRVGELRAAAEGVSTPFFLASNRFVPIKNLDAAVVAYAAYRADGGTWNLCMIGDGPLANDVIAQAAAFGLRIIRDVPWQDTNCHEPTVYFPGFRQIEELPSFYAHASAFLHPAISEPWGLVINEAMASGLPIVASRNGGAVEELVDEGVNGITFDPTDVRSMAGAMTGISGLSDELLASWGRHSKRILTERMPTSAFGDGLQRALQILADSKSSRSSDA